MVDDLEPGLQLCPKTVTEHINLETFTVTNVHLLLKSYVHLSVLPLEILNSQKQLIMQSIAKFLIV